MAGVKISALPALASPAGTDIFPTVQGGTTYKVQLQQIAPVVSFSTAVRLATTGALTATYNNGSSGVGATLTNAGALAALSIDSVSTVVGDRILVKDQATTFQNGIYTVTTVGDASTAWVLTRAVNYDEPSEIATGGMFTVSFGTVNSLTQWIETAVVASIGVDPITFSTNIAAGIGLTKTNNTLRISATPTAGVLLRGNGTNWVSSTSTFADTYAVSTLLYAGSANAVSGLATTNRAALSTNATGVPTWLALSDGQIVIGSTAGAPAAAQIIGTSGISVANGSNTITISGTGSGIGWNEVTGATQSMSADSGYVANRATLITFTLPVTAAFGTAISLIGKGAGGWIIAQNAGQNIQVGSVSSSVGVGGSVASTNQFDSINLICTTADTTWTVTGGPQGTLTIV